MMAEGISPITFEGRRLGMRANSTLASSSPRGKELAGPQGLTSAHPEPCRRTSGATLGGIITAHEFDKSLDAERVSGRSGSEEPSGRSDSEESSDSTSSMNSMSSPRADTVQGGNTWHE